MLFTAMKTTLIINRKSVNSVFNQSNFAFLLSNWIWVELLSTIFNGLIFLWPIKCQNAEKITLKSYQLIQL